MPLKRQSVMALGYLISASINAVIVGLLVAVIEEKYTYTLKPPEWLLVALALGIPILLELLSWYFEQMPFLVLVVPSLAALL